MVTACFTSANDTKPLGIASSFLVVVEGLAVRIAARREAQKAATEAAFAWGTPCDNWLLGNARHGERQGVKDRHALALALPGLAGFRELEAQFREVPRKTLRDRLLCRACLPSREASDDCRPGEKGDCKALLAG